LTVWNRTPERARDLEALGAHVAATPAELARRCDVVVACLTDSPQVEAVLFGDDGLAAGLAPGALVIDCSTISPLKAQEFAGRLATAGVAMLDAPVSGGSEGAKNATLSIMVGGGRRRRRAGRGGSERPGHERDAPRSRGCGASGPRRSTR
jgi:3-hydroxyisobutyrate dehydrogenase